MVTAADKINTIIDSRDIPLIHNILQENQTDEFRKELHEKYGGHKKIDAIIANLYRAYKDFTRGKYDVVIGEKWLESLTILLHGLDTQEYLCVCGGWKKHTLITMLITRHRGKIMPIFKQTLQFLVSRVDVNKSSRPPMAYQTPLYYLLKYSYDSDDIVDCVTILSQQQQLNIRSRVWTYIFDMLTYRRFAALMRVLIPVAVIDDIKPMIPRIIKRVQHQDRHWFLQVMIESGFYPRDHCEYVYLCRVSYEEIDVEFLRMALDLGMPVMTSTGKIAAEFLIQNTTPSYVVALTMILDAIRQKI